MQTTRQVFLVAGRCGDCLQKNYKVGLYAGSEEVIAVEMFTVDVVRRNTRGKIAISNIHHEETHPQYVCIVKNH